MIKKIAMYVNSNGEITDLNQAGFVKIFSKDSDNWNIVKEMPFEFYTVQGKEDIRLDTLNITEALENCKVLVARKISYLIYMMLDGIGVSTWKMEGDQNKILQYVLDREEEAAEEIKLIDSRNFSSKKQIINPIQIGNNGYYIINLKEIQENNTGITTKQALKPFLYNEKFKELIVTCSHIPYWLESELEKLKLNFEFSKTGQNEYIIIINHYGK